MLAQPRPGIKAGLPSADGRPKQTEVSGRGTPALAQVQRIVIVGAGQAGGEAAQRLRTAGFAGELTLIGEEPLPPYQRPPLSKKYLLGEMPLEHVLLRPASLLEEEGIAFLKSVRA